MQTGNFIKAFVVTVFLLGMGFLLMARDARSDSRTEDFIGRAMYGEVMLCDTSEQMVQLVGWRFGAGVDDETALRMINSEAGDSACGVLEVGFVPSALSEEFVLDNISVSIYHVNVFQVVDPRTGQTLEVNPVAEQYVVHVEELKGIRG